MTANFNFMGSRRLALGISAIFVLGSLVCFFTRGLNLGIDFTGGNVIQADFKDRPDVAKVREAVSGVVAQEAMIQNFGEKGIIIRTNEDTEESREQVVTVLQKSFPDMTITGFEKVGPVVGGELRRQHQRALGVLRHPGPHGRNIDRFSGWKNGVYFFIIEYLC